MKLYISHEFGFKEDFFIRSGYCPAQLANDDAHDQTRVSIWYGDGYAHTHICPNDPSYGSICIEKETYLRNKDGTPSDILKHEYAHILDLEQHRHIFTSVRCLDNLMHAWEGDTKFTKEVNEYMADDFHGPSWRNIMKKLGVTPTRIMAAP